MTKEEIIEECRQRLGFETDYEMYSLCQHEKDFYNAIIKALEQQPSDEEITITMKKGTLKYSGKGYVVYNKEWFRKHFSTEVEIMTGYDGYIEQQTSDDCVTRSKVIQEVFEIIDMYDSGEYLVYEDEEQTKLTVGNDRENDFRRILSEWEAVQLKVNTLPPVTPTHGTCKDCKHWKDSDGVYRRGIGAESKCPVNSSRVFDGTFYCADFEKRGNENGSN